MKNDFNNQNRINYEMLINGIDEAFIGCSKLLVLRIDVGYEQDSSNPFLSHEERRNNGLQAKEDLEDFIDNMDSTTLFNHLRGYALKIEYGTSKGFHCHLLFLLNGSRVQRDICIAEGIGEYWESITRANGRNGLYHNCNKDKDKYDDNCGIGAINYTDKELIANLKNNVAPYLTKLDEYIETLGIGETFGIGGIKTKTNNRGKPRKYP